jgi:hypothetical protein
MKNLKQTLLALLARVAGSPRTPTPDRDLDSFFGSWTADPVTDQALAKQRTSDPMLWR